MSSYNENLHSSVVASLQAQELELKQLKAQKNAAMFTLYYAQGATITANEQLTNAKSLLRNKTRVKQQAVMNSNISNNLLNTANQTVQYLKQSTSNTAVAAANIQVAANAIVRLASDLGSIYSIVQAADARSEIYTHAANALQLINETAYRAEESSQTAMEASALTAEVSASTVMNKAKSTNDLMNSILKLSASDFASATDLVANDNAILAGVNASEKIAEGKYEDAVVDIAAAKNAYQASNSGLNLGLQVTDTNATGFTIQFEPLKAPFKQPQTTPFYPVKNYYAIVVKDSKKSTFSISNAENLLLYGIDDTTPVVSEPKKETKKEQTDKKDTELPGQKFMQIVLPKEEGRISQAIVFQAMLTPGGQPFVLQDADGDNIQLGTKYVVFLLAVLQDDYKKKLNVFDDYLSAPSAPFNLKRKLVAADAESIKFLPPSSAVKESLTFTVAENPDYANVVEYRCVFLPKQDIAQVHGLLDSETMDALKKEVSRLEEISDVLDPEIAAAQQDIFNIESVLNGLEDKRQALIKERKNVHSGRSISDVDKKAQLKTNKLMLDETNAEIGKQTALQKEKQDYYNDLLAERKAETGGLADAVEEPIGFLFNLKIAEQVLAGNYAGAHKATKTATAKEEIPDEVQGPLHVASKKGYAKVKWSVAIGPATTDNFGNPLLEGEEYLPVILSICTAKEENLAMFHNNWTGYIGVPSFTYKTTI